MNNPAYEQQPEQTPSHGYPQQQQQPGSGGQLQQGDHPPQQADELSTRTDQAGNSPEKGEAYPAGDDPPPKLVGKTAPLESGGGPDPETLFAEKAIRQAFVSKVFSILSIQLMFTSIMIGLFVLNKDVKVYVLATSQIWILLGFGLFVITYIVLVCSESARRTSPCNLILLTALTFSYALMAAVISCGYNTSIVMFAFLATALSCTIIVTFAKTTSYDITGCGTGLCLITMAHFSIGMVMLVILVPLGYANALDLIISISGASLASLYFVYHLQLIMGGRKCEISPEEYILACVMLYVDIMQIFLYLLKIIGWMR